MLKHSYSKWEINNLRGTEQIATGHSGKRATNGFLRNEEPCGLTHQDRNMVATHDILV